MKRNSQYVSMVVMLLHVLIVLWYYNHHYSFTVTFEAKAKIILFGMGYACVGLNMALGLMCSTLIHKVIICIHCGFILTLSLAYFIYYSGFWDGLIFETLVNVCTFIFFISLVILYSAKVNGKFKNDH